MQLVGSWIPTSHKPPTVTSGRTKQPQLFSTGGNTSHQFASKTGCLTVLHNACSYVSLAGGSTSVICRDKSRLAATELLYFVAKNIFLSRQTCKFCHDKHTSVATKDVFVATKDVFVATKDVFVATNIILSGKVLSRQKYVCARLCREKHTFVATKDVLCRDKRRVCRDKRRVCRDKHNFVGKGFVATKICLCAALSREAYFCRDKRRSLSRQKTCSVATKDVLCLDTNDTCGSSCLW